jgi:phospholipid/cholesterol/gamma-HCH transport system permease protein
VVAEFDGMGVRSLVVAGTAAVFTGMAFALQSAVYLSRFGADLYVGPLVGCPCCASWDPCSRRSWSAARSRRDHRRARLDEGDGADRRAPAIGVNYVKRLIVPRVWAALFVFPLLTALADFIALVGGMVIAVFERRIDVYLYWNTIFYWVVIRDLVTGVGKSFFFGVIVTLIGAHNGLAMTGGTEGLGRATTATVVQVGGGHRRGLLPHQDLPAAMRASGEVERLGAAGGSGLARARPSGRAAGPAVSLEASGRPSPGRRCCAGSTSRSRGGTPSP